MTIIDVLLKLNYDFQTMSTTDIDQLKVDSKDWESTCVENSEDKLKQLYFKVFKTNPLIRLGMGIAYFWIVKELKKIFNGSNDDDFNFESDD